MSSDPITLSSTIILVGPVQSSECKMPSRDKISASTMNFFNFFLNRSLGKVFSGKDIDFAQANSRAEQKGRYCGDYCNRSMWLKCVYMEADNFIEMFLRTCAQISPSLFQETGQRNNICGSKENTSRYCYQLKVWTVFSPFLSQHLSTVLNLYLTIS